MKTSFSLHRLPLRLLSEAWPITLAGLLSALTPTSPAQAAQTTPAPTGDGLWYYQIGGAQPVSPPANPSVVSITLGGSADLSRSYSCGKFDPLAAVTHSLNDIARGVDDMMNAMVAAASSAIASLPALILQRANPGLYDLFQNALLQARETLKLATKTCEQMEAEIAAGKNPYADLLTLSKGNDWKTQMGIGGNDAVSAKETVEKDNGKNGVPWIGGQAGGSGQAPLKFTGDLVEAGYNINLNTAPGWKAAGEVARSAGGPWPQLDEARFREIVDECAADLLEDQRPTADQACLLLGIGVVPIDDTATIPGWPADPTAELARDMLRAWSRDLRALFELRPDSPARDQLRNGAWVHAELPEGASLWGGRIEPGTGPGGPYAPVDLWRQAAQSGLRTRLLPRLVMDREQSLPVWAEDMGLEYPPDASSRDRILRALDRLLQYPSAKDDERDLIDLYGRLVNGALRVDPPPAIPLLYRYVDQRGGMRGLEWGTAEDGVWHGPGGAASSALSAFRDVRIWVYRGATGAKAKALGLVNFEPGNPEIIKDGASNGGPAENLRGRIWQALPDLLAAASMAREEFDQQGAIKRQAELEVVHFDRVWVCWSFNGKAAERGRDEDGDVFLLPRPDRAPALCFDGKELPLVECAFPLSELLCGSRAFGALFRDGLYAWIRAGAGGEGSPSVARFRRDHNLTEADIVHCSTRLEEVRLDDDERRSWRERVTAVLAQYGEVRDGHSPGAIVTPRRWTSLRAGGDIAEGQMRDEIAASLADHPQFRPLIPIVDFRGTHCQEFISGPRREYIAAAADARGRSAWSEALLEELREAGTGVRPEEESGFAASYSTPIRRCGAVTRSRRMRGCTQVRTL